MGKIQKLDAMQGLEAEFHYFEDHNKRKDNMPGLAIFNQLAKIKLKTKALASQTLKWLKKHRQVEYAEMDVSVRALGGTGSPSSEAEPFSV